MLEQKKSTRPGAFPTGPNPSGISSAHTKYEKALLRYREENFEGRFELIRLSKLWKIPEPNESSFFSLDDGRLGVSREWALLALNTVLEPHGISVRREKFRRMAAEHGVYTCIVSRRMAVEASGFAKLLESEGEFYSSTVPTAMIAELIGVTPLAICKRIENGGLEGEKRHGKWGVPKEIYEKLLSENSDLSVLQAVEWLKKRGLCSRKTGKNGIRTLKSLAIRIVPDSLGRLKVRRLELEEYERRARNPEQFADEAKRIANSVPADSTASESDRKKLALLGAQGSKFALQRLCATLEIQIEKAVANSLRRYGELDLEKRRKELEAVCARAMPSIAKKYLYLKEQPDFTQFFEGELKHALFCYWQAKKRWHESRTGGSEKQTS